MSNKVHEKRLRELESEVERLRAKNAKLEEQAGKEAAGLRDAYDEFKAETEERERAEKRLRESEEQFREDF